MAGVSLKELASESAVHGVVVISGLLVIVANQSDTATHEVLIKVLLTAGVFWLAHVYSGAVAHLGDHVEQGERPLQRLRRALRDSVQHSWGMLAAALVPLVLLGLGALGVIGHDNAIWWTLWIDVAILGVVGYLGVSNWTPRQLPRIVGGLCTAALGVLLIALKALIH